MKIFIYGPSDLPNGLDTPTRSESRWACNMAKWLSIDKNLEIYLRSPPPISIILSEPSNIKYVTTKEAESINWDLVLWIGFYPDDDSKQMDKKLARFKTIKHAFCEFYIHHHHVLKKMPKDSFWIFARPPDEEIIQKYKKLYDVEVKYSVLPYAVYDTLISPNPDRINLIWPARHALIRTAPSENQNLPIIGLEHLKSFTSQILNSEKTGTVLIRSHCLAMDDVKIKAESIPLIEKLENSGKVTIYKESIVHSKVLQELQRSKFSYPCKRAASLSDTLIQGCLPIVWENFYIKYFNDKFTSRKNFYQVKENDINRYIKDMSNDEAYIKEVNKLRSAAPLYSVEEAHSLFKGLLERL